MKTSACTLTYNLYLNLNYSISVLNDAISVLNYSISVLNDAISVLNDVERQLSHHVLRLRP